MDRIVARVEQDPGWRAHDRCVAPGPGALPADAIAAAARQVGAHHRRRGRSVAFTASGSTALRVARERPEAPVLGLTPRGHRAPPGRGLGRARGRHGGVHSMSETVPRAARFALVEGFATRGEEMVVIAGVPFGQPGTTNALRVAPVK